MILKKNPTYTQKTSPNQTLAIIQSYLRQLFFLKKSYKFTELLYNQEFSYIFFHLTFPGTCFEAQFLFWLAEQSNPSYLGWKFWM